MRNLIQAAASIWKRTLILTAVIGGALVIGGIALAFFPRPAEVQYDLFGAQLTTTSVGVAIACFGVLLVALLVRRTLASVDRVTSELDN